MEFTAASELQLLFSHLLAKIQFSSIVVLGIKLLLSNTKKGGGGEGLKGPEHLGKCNHLLNLTF